MAHKGRGNADEVIAAALATGATAAEAAERAKVNPRTVFRRQADPAFRARVAELRRGILDATLGKMADGLADAVATLRDLLGSENDTARLGAARTLLDMTVRIRDHVELGERVRELEALITELQANGENRQSAGAAPGSGPCDGGGEEEGGQAEELPGS